MITNSPFSARDRPPITGESIIGIPYSEYLLAIFLEEIGFIVLMSDTINFSCLPCMIPSDPKETDSTAEASLTIVITSSDSLATFFGEFAIFAPNFFKGSVFSTVLL